MSTTYNLSISKNPQFQTVLSLANKTFDRTNVRNGYMATEDQIQQLWQDIIDLEERIDYCCRDIVFWDFRVRVRDKYGNIVSDYLQNRTTGIMRRGKNFVMTLPISAIPKYEGATAFTSTGTNVDGDYSCYTPVQRSRPFHDICGLIYRGKSGEYYEMSQRKTTNGLDPNGPGAFSVYHVDADGNVSPYNMINTSSTSGEGSYIPGSTHFAYVGENDVLYMSVYYPIPEANVRWATGSSPETRKPYGRIYQLDVRDVTLGD